MFENEVNSNCRHKLSPIYVVSTKCSDPRVLEFVVSNITATNRRGNCISVDFNFRGLSEPRNSRKLEPHHFNNDFTVDI